MNVTRPTLLRLQEVLKQTGLCRSTLYALIKSQLFPSQISLSGGRSVGWIESEVIAVITARIAGKTDAEITALVRSLEMTRNAGGGQ